MAFSCSLCDLKQSVLSTGPVPTQKTCVFQSTFASRDLFMCVRECTPTLAFTHTRARARTHMPQVRRTPSKNSWTGAAESGTRWVPEQVPAQKSPVENVAHSPAPHEGLRLSNSSRAVNPKLYQKCHFDCHVLWGRQGSAFVFLLVLSGKILMKPG